MSENTQIILGIVCIIIVYILTRKVHAWRIKRACIGVIEDLKRKEAFDPSSAVALPYARKVMFRFGTRDYRPRAIQYLIVTSIVGMTDNGNYYLKNKDVGLPGSK